MSIPFRSVAFAQWVPEFVAASHRRAGISRQPSVAEIAAYRALFALERIALANVMMFLHHAIGPEVAPATARPQLTDRLGELNDRELDIDDWCERFLSQRLLRDGNARCARALRTWHRLRTDDGKWSTEYAEACPAPSTRIVNDPPSRPH